jgi:DJ-1 family protein
MTAKVLMIMAEGFEETEAIVPADILRRLNIDLTLAGLSGKLINGAHNIPVTTDCTLDSLNPANFNAVILPGGMPGSNNLKNSETVLDFVSAIYNNQGLACAICAAPIVLGKAGILDGKNFTCYPGFETQCPNGKYTAKLTEKDGMVITGKGPGAAFAFASEIAKALGKGEELKQVLAGMFVNC